VLLVERSTHRERDVAGQLYLDAGPGQRAGGRRPGVPWGYAGDAIGPGGAVAPGCAGSDLPAVGLGHVLVDPRAQASL